jgi:hypothetical protein
MTLLQPRGGWSVQRPASKGIQFPRHCIRTGSTFHSQLSPIDAESKAVGAGNWPLIHPTSYIKNAWTLMSIALILEPPLIIIIIISSSIKPNVDIRNSSIPIRIRMVLGSYYGHETNIWLRLFVDFLSAPNANLVPQIRPRSLPSKSLLIRYTVITSFFDPFVNWCTSNVAE